MSVAKKNEIFLPKSYKPSEVEPYMNPMHLEFFQTKLLEKRATLEEEWEDLNETMHSNVTDNIEIMDRVNQDIIIFSTVQKMEMIKKNITSIDTSLQDIQTKKYGFCKKTGKQIGIKRLIANPEAKLCFEMQEELEMKNQSTDYTD